MFNGCTMYPKKSWDTVNSPTTKMAKVYGKYSAGCLDGAESLAANANEFQVMRIARKRFYGHPQLVQFIESHAREVTGSQLGTIAIGDMSQARGGPMPGGHHSHQSGLDVDIWFKRFSESEKNALTLNDLQNMSAPSMVNEAGTEIDEKQWQADTIKVLESAASHKKVERIFVNYLIKKQLCVTNKGEKWLSKIRPWWGHTAHYHVRLACPPNSLTCKAQATVKETDGCDETLDWWFTEEAKIDLTELSVPVIKEVVLPSQCEAVLHRTPE